MKSMTGYGNTSFQSKGIQLEISVRAVNGRFFDCRIHTPKEYSFLENEIKKVVQKHIDRGTVDVYVSRIVSGLSTHKQIYIDLDLAKKLQTAYGKIGTQLKVDKKVIAEQILKHPEVVQVKSQTEVTKEETKDMLKQLAKSCQACNKEKQREGDSLTKEFEKLLGDLSAKVLLMQEFREQANSAFKQKFETRLKTKLDGVDMDPNRLNQEIIIYLDRSDINEEIQRLGEHVDNYKKLIQLDEPIGKKLDFYTQELLREVNTIGSKANLTKLTEIVVEAKTIIERLREQVQNVE